MSGQYCVDANIFITTWNTSYRIKTFPSLWQKIAQHMHDIILVKPIYDQIDPMSSEDNKNLSVADKTKKYPLHMWLSDNDFIDTPVNIETQQTSLALESKYQIENHASGADQKDITLIAYAKLNNKTVVTLESKQEQAPQRVSDYKIPLICQKEGIRCINFVDLLQELEIVV